MRDERHPTMFGLEAHHAGEGPAATARHLLVCSSCAEYVRGLDEEAADFRGRINPEEFVRQIRRRAGTSQLPGRRSPLTFLIPLAGALGVVAVCLAVLRSPPGLTAHVADELRPRGGDGGAAVTVILWHARDGHQSRHSAEVVARPGDRLRVEVTVARATELEAAILDDSGGRTSLGSPRAFAAGTHLLEPTFTFDSRPFAARILVGPPDGVAHALAGQPDDRVRSVAVRVADGASVPGREGSAP
jgi:hypothetical protein